MLINNSSAFFRLPLKEAIIGIVRKQIIDDSVLLFSGTRNGPIF